MAKYGTILVPEQVSDFPFMCVENPFLFLLQPTSTLNERSHIYYYPFGVLKLEQKLFVSIAHFEYSVLRITAHFHFAVFSSVHCTLLASLLPFAVAVAVAVVIYPFFL